MHPGDGYVLGHGRYISLPEVDTRNEQMNQVCRQGFSRWLERPPAGLHAGRWVLPIRPSALARVRMRSCPAARAWIRLAGSRPEDSS
jgi:hypothetical protein